MYQIILPVIRRCSVHPSLSVFIQFISIIFYMVWTVVSSSLHLKAKISSDCCQALTFGDSLRSSLISLGVIGPTCGVFEKSCPPMCQSCPHIITTTNITQTNATSHHVQQLPIPKLTIRGQCWCYLLMMMELVTTLCTHLFLGNVNLCNKQCNNIIYIIINNITIDFFDLFIQKDSYSMHINSC